MQKSKTVETNASVDEYLSKIVEQTRRDDCISLAKLMARASKKPGKMWGSGIVGFGSYHYRYESGREGESCLVGFSSRKGDISIYGLRIKDANETLLQQLGRYKTGKGCLYVSKLSDIEPKVLEQLVKDAVAKRNSTQ